jgi:hypothetical protein
MADMLQIVPYCFHFPGWESTPVDVFCLNLNNEEKRRGTSKRRRAGDYLFYRRSSEQPGQVVEGNLAKRRAAECRFIDAVSGQLGNSSRERAPPGGWVSISGYNFRTRKEKQEGRNEKGSR